MIGLTTIENDFPCLMTFHNDRDFLYFGIVKLTRVSYV